MTSAHGIHSLFDAASLGYVAGLDASWRLNSRTKRQSVYLPLILYHLQAEDVTYSGRLSRYLAFGLAVDFIASLLAKTSFLLSVVRPSGLPSSYCIGLWYP